MGDSVSTFVNPILSSQTNNQKEKKSIPFYNVASCSLDKAERVSLSGHFHLSVNHVRVFKRVFPDNR